ncbi:MAG: O-antigen ligase family protein [Candidatus Krumholzibacteria bacterium]|nr:O-antigen ligase family protein [Candidatus Krumholzibacteria bacterium]
MHPDTSSASVGTIPPALQFALGAFVFASTFSIAASQTALGATLLIYIFYVLRKRLPLPRRTALDVPFAVFAAASFAAALFSGKRLESLANLKNLILIVAAYLVAYLATASTIRKRLFIILLFSGVGSAVYGIAIHLLGLGKGSLGRSSGSFSTAMTYGGILLILSSIYLAVALGPLVGRRLRIAAGLSALVTFIALFFSLTRSSWVGALVSAVVILSLLRRKLLVPFAAALVIFVALLPAAYRARVESIWNPKFRTNVQRLELLRGGISIFREHPVIGVGTMDLADIYAEHMPPGAVHIHGHMHNDFLQIAVQMGVVGLAAFTLLIVSFFLLMVRNLRLDLPPPERAWVAGSIGALAGFIVNGLFEWNFGDAEVVTLMYVVIGENIAIWLERLRVQC